MSHRMPSTAEIRQRIESVKDEKYRLCFQYQYLIAGRISEVCGKYAPKGFEAIEVEFVSNGETYPAVLFAVKTAKRKSERGWSLRPCAVPLNSKYEPWAQPLLDYFKKRVNDYPFMFAEKPKTSKRYVQWVAEDVFEDLEWPMRGYTRGKKGNKKNIPERWNPFRSHCLRKLRSLDLMLSYKFDGLDLKAYGGWEEKGKESHIADSMKHYLHLDISEAKTNITLLKRIADKYFHKLLLPIEKIIGQ